MSTARRWREVRDFVLSLGIAAPPAAVALWLARGDRSTLEVVAAALVASVGLVAWRRGRFTRRLGTMASVLAAFRQGDYSVRARGHGDAALGDVLQELNQLGDTLRSHRLGEMEAWALLRKVMAEIDVVVLAFDEPGRVALANDAAARVLKTPASSLVGRPVAEIGLAELLEGDAPRAVRGSAALGPGPWELRRGTFRLSGQLHTLAVLSDVSGALREQEREAWKRLIRVMGHEINNSLAPIRSIAQSLMRARGQAPRPADWEEDLASGLSVIERRADSLSRFTGSYAQLARLPAPRLGRVEVSEWVRRSVRLETRLPVEVSAGPDAFVRGDTDQLDQLLINLVKNAADATLEAGAGGAVRVRWTTTSSTMELLVEDDGPGVGDATNLFVPFFTTKAGGSGIGLVLVRQIAEAHGGKAYLRDRSGARGAVASVVLPLTSARA